MGTAPVRAHAGACRDRAASAITSPVRVRVHVDCRGRRTDPGTISALGPLPAFSVEKRGMTNHRCNHRNMGSCRPNPVARRRDGRSRKRSFATRGTGSFAPVLERTSALLGHLAPVRKKPEWSAPKRPSPGLGRCWPICRATRTGSMARFRRRGQLRCHHSHTEPHPIADAVDWRSYLRHGIVALERCNRVRHASGQHARRCWVTCDVRFLQL